MNDKTTHRLRDEDDCTLQQNKKKKLTLPKLTGDFFWSPEPEKPTVACPCYCHYYYHYHYHYHYHYQYHCCDPQSSTGRVRQVPHVEGNYPSFVFIAGWNDYNHSSSSSSSSSYCFLFLFLFFSHYHTSSRR